MRCHGTRSHNICTRTGHFRVRRTRHVSRDLGRLDALDTNRSAENSTLFVAPQHDLETLFFHFDLFLPRRTVLAPAGAVGVLRTPVVNHGHNVTKWAPTVLAVFAHASCNFLCFKMPVLDYKIYYPFAACFYLRLSPIPSTENVVNLFL